MTARMPRAVGNSIATVAVLDTNADSRQVISPNAMITRLVLRPTPGSERIRKANRLATPCFSIAAARMNAPMKVKTVELPKGASTSSAEAPPSRTIMPTPSSPPIGMGTASLIHSTMTNNRHAARVCWLLGRSSGSNIITTSTTGARNNPIVRRPFSNRSSAGESFCSPRLRYVPTWSSWSAASKLPSSGDFVFSGLFSPVSGTAVK